MKLLTGTGLILALLFTVFNAGAQAVIEVDVSGLVFTPANVTIDIGDTVRWTNTGGTHNVNGLISTYPLNPESFGNAVADAPWVYSYVFNTVGTYDYQCDVHLAAGMVGTVTVSSPTTGIAQTGETNKALIDIYPIPATDHISIRVTEKQLQNPSDLNLIVFDVNGNEMVRVGNINTPVVNLNTTDWAKSVYLIGLFNGSEIIDSQKVIVQ